MSNDRRAHVLNNFVHIVMVGDLIKGVYHDYAMAKQERERLETEEPMKFDEYVIETHGLR